MFGSHIESASRHVLHIVIILNIETCQKILSQQSDAYCGGSIRPKFSLVPDNSFWGGMLDVWPICHFMVHMMAHFVRIDH